MFTIDPDASTEEQAILQSIVDNLVFSGFADVQSVAAPDYFLNGTKVSMTTIGFVCLPYTSTEELVGRTIGNINAVLQDQASQNSTDIFCVGLIQLYKIDNSTNIPIDSNLVSDPVDFSYATKIQFGYTN